MTIHRLSTLAALCLLPAFLLPSPAEAEGFQGTFSGQGVMMTLQPAQDRYYGTLIFDEGFYSIKADEKDGELSGSFFTDRGEFDFKASFRGNALALETNSITYLLYRAGQEPPEVPDPEPAADAEPESDAEALAPEGAAEATPTTPTAEPAAPVMVAEEAEETQPAMDAEPTSGGALASMSFESGVLPDTRGARSAASEEDAEPRPERATADSHGFQPVDQDLVGVWQRQPASADTVLAGATGVELGADGGFSATGPSASGHWKAEEQILFLQTSDAEDWQPYCRYTIAGDSLLCTVDDDTRELWFRR